MWRQRGTIEVDDAAWIVRGDHLVIGEGDEAEMIRAVAVDGRTVTIGRWRWYHGRARQVRHWLLEARFAAQEFLCGLRGHRLTVESRDVDGRALTLYCWCARRYRYIGGEDQ